MTIKELSGYVADHRQIESIEKRIQRIEDSLTHITAVLSGMPRGATGRDKMAKLVSELTDLKTEKAEKLIRLETNMRRVETALDELPDIERIVMRYRFVECLPWREVAKKTNYSESYLYVIKKAAMKRLNK